MSAKCAVCKKAIVSQKGQVCITCQMNQKIVNPAAAEVQPPYQSGSAGTEVKNNTFPQSNMRYAKGYHGTVHNYHQSNVKRSLLWKLWNSCIRGVPFSISDTQYEFTLYEEGNIGVRGHEVVLYGDAGYSLLSDNSEVIVMGKPDRNGVIIASEISGVNTGFRMRSRNAVPAAVIRILMILLVVVIIAGFVSVNSAAGTASGGAAYDMAAGRVLLCAIAILMSIVILKTRIRKKYWYATLLILFALGLYNTVCLALFAILLACMILLHRKK